MPLIFKGVPSVGEFQLSTWASMQYEHWCMWFHYFLCLSRLLLTICAIWQNLVWQFEDWELDLLLNYIYGLFKLPAPNVWSGKLLSKKKRRKKTAQCFTTFQFQIWIGKTVNLIWIFKIVLCPCISNSISKEFLQANFVSVFTRIAEI